MSMNNSDSRIQGDKQCGYQIIKEYIMALKINQEHLQFIKEQFLTKSKDELKKYKELLKTDSLVKDIEQRFRWDLLYGLVGSEWVCDNLYPYLNDDHIDSALKQICKELEI